MKLTCKSKRFSLKKTPKTSGYTVVLVSSKNNTRISVCKGGNLLAYTSTSRSSVYPGYERRLNIAAYTAALAFGKELLKDKQLRKAKFDIKLKGVKKHALFGLLDSGLRVRLITEKLNVPFNGCRKKKGRRR